MLVEVRGVRGGRRGRRVTVRSRSCRGGRSRRRRRLIGASLSSRGQGGRSINPGSSENTTHLSAATVAVLNEIGSIAWKNEEPQSYTQEYTQTPGPTSLDVTGDSTPLELFCRFFSEDVWDLMKEETNRYANVCITDDPSGRAWSDTTIEELKAFVGMLILMGIVRLPRLELYWSTNFPLISTRGISNVMPKTKFEQLFRFFHLNDNSKQVPYGQDGHDKLFKVRKLLDLLCPLFEAEFQMHQSCTIDEAMIPFKGRLRFKQYMKDKPTKWGIKVFVLSDAPTGYVKRMQVYTGKGLDTGMSDVGLCTKVVLDLMEGFDNMGVQLYTDNFYTSPLLYYMLYKHGVSACGTVRPQRLGFPSELIVKASEANRGLYEYRSNGPLLACSWVDKRSLYFLSTMHVGERVGNPTVKSRQADGTLADISCPPCLPDYQKYMRGVDRGDQLESYYNVSRKSKKSFVWKCAF